MGVPEGHLPNGIDCPEVPSETDKNIYQSPKPKDTNNLLKCEISSNLWINPSQIHPHRCVRQRAQLKLRVYCNRVVGIPAVEGRPHTHPGERRGIPQWNQRLSSCQEKRTSAPQSYLMCNEPGRLKMTAAMHNRKGNRTAETQGNFQTPDVQIARPPTADVPRSVSVASSLAAALPVSNVRFFGFSSVLKGWRQRTLSSSFSQIKASTPKLGWTHIWKPFTL